MLSRLSPYLLWAVLALPSFGMVAQALTSETTAVYRDLLHPSGEFAARLMIVAMMATPLMMLFRGWRGPRWLVRNRRYFGVAAFGYAALHTALYGRTWREDCPAAQARNETLRTTRHFGRALWKRLTGYQARSRIESKMRCLKAFGDRIMAKDPDRRSAEIHNRIALMNRFSALGRAEITPFA